MRLRARSLHVLALAPVAALAAGVLGSTTHAHAASGAPPAIVVALDPGHGGLPNLSDASQPFDPGAIGPNGLMEKDVTLDIAQRLAALLGEDLVQVVLTRTSDTWVTIADRESVAGNSHASLFVSVHCNAYTGPSVGGSLVLFPSRASQPFAQAISDALGRGLASAGVASDGIQLRDNWWVHNTMPTATAEVAYISNPHEAALMATADFRQQAAVALRDGIERYDPDIAVRKAQLIDWARLHPGQPLPTAPPARAAAAVQPAPAPPPSALPAVLFWVLLLAALGAAVRSRARLLRWSAGFPERVAPALAWTSAAASRLEPLFQHTAIRRSALRRRRRRMASRAVQNGPRRWTPYSVYDELAL
jgi:N-acetylmuramoyl-L-alanine amidase